MAQMIYIDPDEEIISVVARLRTATEQELVFVIPKRALILQSAINLRLFQRESEKLQKSVRIATQDDAGRKIVERVGIELAPFGPENDEQRARFQGPAGSQPIAPQPQPQRAIGSTRFDTRASIPGPAPTPTVKPPAYSQPRTMSSGGGGMHIASPSPERTLRVRDMSPMQRPALNSTPVNKTIPRHDLRAVSPPPAGGGPSASRFRSSQESVLRPTTPLSRTISAPAPVLKTRPSIAPTTPAPVMDARPQPGSQPMPMRPVSLPPQNVGNQPVRRTPPREIQIRDEQLRKFFSDSHPTKPPAHSGASLPPVETGVQERSSWKWWLFGAGIVLLISVVGALILFFLPRAEVRVVPQTEKRTVEREFIGYGSTSAFKTDEAALPVRIVQKDIALTLPFKATGAAQSGGQKARGTVILSNEYSPQTQVLIASTRLESPEGKIFRLLETVSVPGYSVVNSKREPGVLEVKVVADEPGESYNLGPTTFSIPGLRGSGKYEKVTGKSTRDMTGGLVIGDALPTVLKSDMDRALDDARSEAKKRMNEALKGEISEGERLLEGTFEVKENGEVSLPIVGTAGSEFEIAGSFTVRAFVISEEALRKKLFAEDSPGGTQTAFEPRAADITYLDILPRFSEESVTLRVRADLWYVARIDSQALRSELAGMSENDVQHLLEASTHIQRMSIVFRPDILLRNFPRDPERITVVVDEEER